MRTLGAALTLAAPAIAVLADAFAERLHEIDDLRALPRLFDLPDLAMLGLGLDQFAQGFGVGILEIFRVEALGLALDQLLGKLDHVVIDLRLLDFRKSAVGFFYF